MSKKNQKIELNLSAQFYKGVRIRLIKRDYGTQRAKRFLLGKEKNNHQNVWIPNIYLNDDGTVKPDANIDFVFKQAYYQNKFEYAGIAIDPRTW